MAATAALEAVEPAIGHTADHALRAHVLPAAAAQPDAVVLRQASVPAGNGQDKRITPSVTVNIVSNVATRAF